MGQRRLTWSAIPRALYPTGRLALSPVAVVVGLLVVTGASGYVSASSGPSSMADRAPAAPAVGGSADRAASMAPESSSLACPMLPAAGNSGDGIEKVGSASHLFTRTTGDGVTIRTYHLSSSGNCGCGTTASVSVELSDQSAVGQGFLGDEPDPVATTANVGSEPVGVASGAFGVVEGSPVWWTAVAVGPEVATVSMTYPDGSTDQMSPVDGVAVLAGQIKAATAGAGDGPYQVRGTLRLLDASGALVTTVTLPESTPTPIETPVPLPINLPANRATPLLGTTSSPAASSTPSSSSGSSGSSSGSSAASPPSGAGATIACPEMVAPAATSAR